MSANAPGLRMPCRHWFVLMLALVLAYAGYRTPVDTSGQTGACCALPVGYVWRGSAVEYHAYLPAERLQSIPASASYAHRGLPYALARLVSTGRRLRDMSLLWFVPRHEA